VRLPVVRCKCFVNARAARLVFAFQGVTSAGSSTASVSLFATRGRPAQCRSGACSRRREGGRSVDCAPRASKMKFGRSEYRSALAPPVCSCAYLVSRVRADIRSCRPSQPVGPPAQTSARVDCPWRPAMRASTHDEPSASSTSWGAQTLRATAERRSRPFALPPAISPRGCVLRHEAAGQSSSSSVSACE
jgi:hypothetical protein